MNLLEWARGPLWWAAIGILVIGGAWRIVCMLRLPAPRDLSEPRSTRLRAGALRAIFALMIPRREFRGLNTATVLIGYVYHVGLAIIAFGYLPHIEFIRRVTGLAWPALPAPAVYFATALTFVALIAALVARMTDPVRRLISSFDDYFSWLVVFLPLATGMAVINLGYGAGAVPGNPLDPMPLAIHLLSVELLLVWLPFGKLAHAFVVFASRGATGAAFARKGVHI